LKIILFQKIKTVFICRKMIIYPSIILINYSNINIFSCLHLIFSVGNLFEILRYSYTSYHMRNTYMKQTKQLFSLSIGRRSIRERRESKTDDACKKNQRLRKISSDTCHSKYIHQTKELLGKEEIRVTHIVAYSHFFSFCQFMHVIYTKENSYSSILRWGIIHWKI
jgi:hypothetical protein